MKLLRNIFNLFYPDICLCCEKQLTDNEQTVCLTCRFDFPITNFTSEKDNLVEKAFYGRIPIQSATALFYFLKKGKVQVLIHQLKYKGQQQVGTFIGNWLGDDLLQSNRFKNVDIIIPVPLHKNKLKTRGYNQVTTFGKALSNKLNIPYAENVLVRTSFTRTQTKKIRVDRWKNVQEIFKNSNPPALDNKHILLIDDIITTGATLEACYFELKKSKNIKISIACMAYTK
ncbi:phosphoribosyltransferase family protein [Lutibacter sp. TH_r2]|uniref:ComF family protein n=1 Tax=Lutibacter sp. TH_r2 TaxID=3082083 RepID=UPI002954A1FF|nr:phosphoribosyltransferase family protein [Lutibacter sp. TH_r2]MDV7186245.1 phosphoribosyltransferase family protein [Lutibacter sp. TH_r2]